MSTARFEYPHVEPFYVPTSEGTPRVEYRIKETRVPVRRLYYWHQKGVSVETLTKRYPNLGWAKVLCALAFAYDHEAVMEEELDQERAFLGQPLEPNQKSLFEK